MDTSAQIRHDVLAAELRAGDELFGTSLPVIAAWCQAPTRTGRDLAWLHLRLTSIRRAPDRLQYLAGSESAMGAFINDIAPEDMAEWVRSAGCDVRIASLP